MEKQREPGKREAKHLAKQRSKRRDNVMPSVTPTQAPIPPTTVTAPIRQDNYPTYDPAAADRPDFTRSKPIKQAPTPSKVRQGKQPKRGSQRWQRWQRSDERAQSISDRKQARTEAKQFGLARAPYTRFFLSLLISLLSVFTATYLLSTSLTKTTHPLPAVALLLLGVISLAYCLRSASRVSGKIGAPALLLSGLAAAAFVVGASTQVVINNHPVLSGSALSHAIKIKNQLTAMGIEIESDRVRYLASTPAEGQARLDTFPRTAASYQGLSATLIKRDPVGLPSLVWEPANKDIALAAYTLATGVTRRIEALNTMDSTAIADVAKDNQTVIDYLAAAYSDINAASVKSGIASPTPSPSTAATTDSNSGSKVTGGGK